MKPALYARSAPGQADHRGADRRGIDPVSRDVHPRQLGGQLVIAERAKRPADVRELERPEDDQERDEQTGEEVVAPDLVVGDLVRGAGHDETGLGARELALAEKQIGERQERRRA